MKTFLMVVGVLLALVIYITYRSKKSVDVEELIRDGAVILDVRTGKEYSIAHIENSVNISLGALRTRYVELDTGKTYIACCSHGLRSIKAVSILKERGFKKVHNGGVWKDLERQIKLVYDKAD